MEISPLVLIFWGEVTFLMAAALIFIGVSSVVKRRKGRKYLSDMFASITSDRDNRKKQLREGLSAYGLEGDNLENRIAEIDKQERLLYKRIAHMYNKRSDVMLSNLPVAVETSTKPYLELSLTAVASQGSEEGSGGDSDIDPAEFKALKEQNEQLQDELSVTMETIGRMLSEYSSMFGSEDDTDLDKGKIMEAFEVGEDDLDEQGNDEDIIEESAEIEDLDVVNDEGGVEDEGDVEVDDFEIEEAPEDIEDEVLEEIPDELDGLGEAVDIDEPDGINLDEVSVSDVDIDDILDDVTLGNDEAAEEETPEAEEDQADLPDSPESKEDEISVDDIDALLDQEIPNDELLEIDDEPLLDSVDLGDDADDVLSDIVNLEENFGEEKNKEDVEDLDGDIADLDIDALLNENKK